jgi:hypothetical protein
MFRFCVLMLLGAVSYSAGCAEYFVSPAGKGRVGSKAEPAKDIGNLGELQPGDVINMAEGVYLGKGEAGRDEILVPVKIIDGTRRLPNAIRGARTRLFFPETTRPRTSTVARGSK